MLYGMVDCFRCSVGFLKIFLGKEGTIMLVHTVTDEHNNINGSFMGKSMIEGQRSPGNHSSRNNMLENQRCAWHVWVTSSLEGGVFEIDATLALRDHRLFFNSKRATLHVTYVINLT